MSEAMEKWKEVCLSEVDDLNKGGCAFDEVKGDIPV